MRIVRRDGQTALLGYCANVHPGESLSSVLHGVRTFAGPVRAELGVSQLALGVWLSRAALDEVEQSGLRLLQETLTAAGLFVVTLNGFPYGDFHAEVVKRRVYHPDLGTDERRSYLLSLARVLAGLLPDDALEGTISTLPVGHRDEPNPAPAAARADAAAVQLCQLCEGLARLRDETGRSIRICLEPEPGCWLERTSDAVAFFSEQLPRVARRVGVSHALLSQHLGVCYDTCHQAVCFEDANDSIRQLTAAGIRIGKAQLSSALEIGDPSDPAVRAELMRFDEPRFLHQVRTPRADGTLASADDLREASQLPVDHPWRVHFHVPIHEAQLGKITTTRPFLEQALPALAALQPMPHLEIETYTWSVLPEAQRPKNDSDLVRGLAAELRFAREALHE
jgi:sugar phosphate isomerase/epimerase